MLIRMYFKLCLPLFRKKEKMENGHFFTPTSSHATLYCTNMVVNAFFQGQKHCGSGGRLCWHDQYALVLVPSCSESIVCIQKYTSMIIFVSIFIENNC